MATYRGSKRIGDVLDAGSIDKQLQKLQQFDQYYTEIMGAAVQDAVDVAGTQAAKNAPRLTGALSAAIFKKYLGVNKSNMQIRGAIGVEKSQGMKGIVMEVGRNYGNRRWRGFFYLYYGATDKADEIRELYAKANNEIVNRLVVR
ncbi:MAG: hypothetical protein CVU44_11325 [Chloroflexi bacterium HGW-Chloroflexi-6]|nr:MAG: hypothetical protein CVU44_11325 [Chloroflexi bacterium HGW-Chloroflexi-6]